LWHANAAAQNHGIIGATAAYAAVLVVVGTTTPGGDLNNGKIAGIVVGVVVWLYT